MTTWSDEPGEVTVVSVGCNSLLRVVERDFAAAFGKEEIVGGELKWRELRARALIKMVIC